MTGHDSEKNCDDGFGASSWKLVQKECIDKGKSTDAGTLEYPRKQSRKKNNIIVKSTFPYKREEVMKWYGWGYPDSSFSFKNGSASFSGNRYPICNTKLPHFKEFLKERLNVELDADLDSLVFEMPKEEDFPPSRISESQMRELTKLKLKLSTLGSDRMIRSHGQGYSEVYHTRNKQWKRIPDIVIWPECHEDVVEVIKICNDNNIVIIPFGGGTSVSGSVTCPPNESRTILVLDTSMMNEILWIDETSLVACCESGIIGQDLERELQKIGYTCGHEPDSSEFSTLGGWVATRASGMKKNLYGNIEDLVVHARMVTPKGILEKGSSVPRLSSGPDFHHVILGSEGCLGVITEVSIKIRPLPELQRYGSLVFPDFESGYNFMRDVAKQRLQPASIRLMDNEQFQFGRTFRPESSSFGLFMDGLKDVYLKMKGYDWSNMCLVTLLFEGDKDTVLAHEYKINQVAAKYGGIPAGEENGKTGYSMTFVIAYIRDVALDLNIFSETMETSVSWENALRVNQSIKDRIASEASKFGIKHFVSMGRIAQTYDSGCCLYIYYAFTAPHLANPLEVSEQIEAVTREEIINGGGSISHHHGVGKVRRKWIEKAISPLGLNMLKACKEYIDPKNIFANVNLVEHESTLIH